MPIPDEQIFPHATGAAEALVAKHQEPQPLVFYAGWVSRACSLIYDKTDREYVVLPIRPARVDRARGEGHPVSVQGGKPVQEGGSFPR